MYTEIGKVTKASIENYKVVLKDAIWKHITAKGHDYKIWFYTGDIKEFPEYTAAFFLQVPSGGAVTKHVDNSTRNKSYCIPIETNPSAYTVSGSNTYNYLEVGKLYEVDKTIEHRSANDGDTDRTHLLIEIKNE